MPISKYFGGNGEKVMKAMQGTYSNPKKAKQVFYATANKQKATPPKANDIMAAKRG